MAKISELTSLAGSAVNPTVDVIAIADISENKTKKLTPASLKSSMGLDIPTIAALKLVPISPSLNGFQVNVGGYYSIGDGGGGQFWFDAASTTADNGGTVIAPSGVATGRWMRIIEDGKAINVKLFGAKFDDISDDTEEIQAVVTAFDVIILPAGTAKITAPIVIPVGKAKQFIGAGFTESVLKAYGTFNAVIQIGNTSNQTERCIFKDFSIILDDAAVVQYGIYGSRAAHTTFDKIQVQGMATAGVSTGYGFCNNYLGCEFSYNAGSGVLLNDDYDAANNIVNFYGCIILLNGGWGIKMFSGNSVHIHGCTIESNQKGGVYAGSVRALTIEDNYFESNASVGETFTTPAVTVKTNILLNGNSLPGVLNSAYPTTSVVISGNYTSDVYAGSFIYSPGVKSLSIENNVGNPETLIPLIDPVSLCDGISVHGNENFTTALTGGCCLHAGGVNQDVKILASGTGAIQLDSKAVANQNLIANANVGIGATTPSSLLHVKGGAGTGIKVETTGAYSIVDLSSPSGQVLLVPINGTLSIQTGGAGAAIERMSITEAGAIIHVVKSTPASATAVGTAGQIAWDENYFYKCIAANTWKRSPLTTW